MKAWISLLLVTVPILFFPAASQNLDLFLKCLTTNPQLSDNPFSDVIYTRRNSSFSSVLNAYIKNRRFLTASTPKPLAIVAAKHESHVQETIKCSKKARLQLRIRSGGHDYEGLSYTSKVQFVVLDMFNFRSIDIHIENETAWVQAGATLGELYYKISNISKVHAFPAGVCVTLGAGGHISGGGFGNLMRKYGLSVDNVIDAQIVDAEGRILNRESMGEDVFWAIRGGGGASFGVILAWKIKLVKVPEKVTVFKVGKTTDQPFSQGATDVVYKWQQIAPELPKELFIRAMPQVFNGSRPLEKTILVSFIGMFLGQTKSLIPLMNEHFPELGLQAEDCQEMSWIESTLFWIDLPNASIDALLDRPTTVKYFSKNKSDYVKRLIPKEDLEKIWVNMINVGRMWMQWDPYGGRMSEISESETPFPHRAGNLFLIQYSVGWQDEGNNSTSVFTDRIRCLYDSMAPYVSKNPRVAFLNYRDLDIGSSPYDDAAVYGAKYFKNNYEKLVRVKTSFDPQNFFRFEQSIPANNPYAI